MENEKVEIREICQNCTKYSRCTKKCVVSGDYTARKASCAEFVLLIAEEART